MSTEIASFNNKLSDGSLRSLKFTRYCGSSFEQRESGSMYRERLRIGSMSISCEEAIELANRILEMFPVSKG